MMHSTPRLGAEPSAHELEVMCGGFQKDVKGEDRFTIHDAIIAGDHCYFAVVADGHGGQDAVIHAAKRILPLIAEAAADGSSVELNRASVQSFRALHEEIFASGTTSGSTLTVCCINASKHELHVWNVGDSLAVLVDATSHAPLGVSHRLESNPEEQARVQALGAKLARATTEGGEEGGPLRAWPGGLAVTRTVGDADCPRFVIPDPAWSTCPVPPQGGALLACTDGVWDLMTASEAATVLIAGEFDSAGSAARLVVRRATRPRGAIDDTTAVVMLFGPAPIDDSDDDMGLSNHRRSNESFLKRVENKKAILEHEDESTVFEKAAAIDPLAAFTLNPMFSSVKFDSQNAPKAPDTTANHNMSPVLAEARPRRAPNNERFSLSNLFDSTYSRARGVRRRPLSSPSSPWAGGQKSPLGRRKGSERSLEDGDNRFSINTFDSSKDGREAPTAGVSGHNGSAWCEAETEAWFGITTDTRPGTRIVDWSELTISKFLGQGEFATAHLTTLDGRNVAIKMLKKEKGQSLPAVQGLKREIMVMTLMDHPNVLKAYALGQHEGQPLMILELLSRTLTSELPRDPDAVPFWVRWREVKRWPLSRSLHCAVQLARALKYVHDDAFPGHRILHRDVKPNNIGFVHDPADHDHLVLFDFGLASLWEKKGDPTDTLARNLTGETGSLRYMAPEVANSRPYCPKAEVYSFATVTYEIASCKKPFTGLEPEVFKKAIGSGHVLPLPPEWPDELRSLISDCWKLDAQQRPEFREIVPRLEALCAVLPRGTTSNRKEGSKCCSPS